MTKFVQDDQPFSLSVVVANRNDGKYLRVCIESVVRQSVPPDEFIILDDESTDNSVEVIEAAIRGYPFARLVRNPKNLGGVQNANHGLSLAKSKYVYFLGANDMVLPGLFERARSCLERMPAGIWSGMVWLMDEEDRYIRMHPSPVIALRDSYYTPEACRAMMCGLGNWLTGQTTIYRREALVEAGGFDPKLKGLCDLLAAHVVTSRYGAAYSPAPLGVMRIHKGAFLTETLEDIAGLDAILDEIELRGPQVEPALFTPEMLRRTRLRFYFASLRLSKGATTSAIMRKYGVARRLLLALTKWIPKALSSVRTGLYFFIMRPFDVLPTIRYRFCGAAWIRLVEQFARRIPR